MKNDEHPILQRMQTDIMSGQIQIDFILAESFSRLGCSEEVPDIITRLHDQFGVPIVLAE